MAIEPERMSGKELATAHEAYWPNGLPAPLVKKLLGHIAFLEQGGLSVVRRRAFEAEEQLKAQKPVVDAAVAFQEDQHQQCLCPRYDAQCATGDCTYCDAEMWLAACVQQLNQKGGDADGRGRDASNSRTRHTTAPVGEAGVDDAKEAGPRHGR